MHPSVKKVFSIDTIFELITLQLDYHEIVRAQRVCRYWKNTIRSSLPLSKACWYLPHDRVSGSDNSEIYDLNPIFNRFGIEVRDSNAPRVRGIFDFNIFNFDTKIWLGSWKSMLATQPPCKRMIIRCGGGFPFAGIA